MISFRDFFPVKGCSDYLKDNTDLAESTLFIGKLIEEELRRQERSVTWLSRKIHCDRRNVYDIFKRADIDTSLLYRISQALHVDFFECYSRQLGAPALQSRVSTATISENTPPIVSRLIINNIVAV